jgi:branched-chain amino acid transport system substrate-binding protein
VSATATYPGLTRAGSDAAPDEPGVYSPTGVRSFARMIPPDDQQAVVAAAWAAQLGVSRVAVVDDGSPRGGRLSASFAEAARRLGLAVVSGPHSIDRRAADYRAVAEEIRTSGPGLVFFAGGSQNHASRFVQDVRATVGPSVAIMATDRIYNQRFLDEAGKDGDGIYVMVNGLPPGSLTDRGAAWYAAYRERFQEEPGIYTVYAYEAARVLLDGISRAGVKDREAIRDAVLTTTDFDGLLGTFSFDPQGDPTIVKMSGRQVVGNSFDDQHAVILGLPAPSPGD